MRQFLKDTRGSAVIWTAFLILILFTLAFVVYTGVTVYAKYQACENELQRAATAAVNKSLVNPNVRDLELNIPDIPAQSVLEENLIGTGWSQDGQSWVKRDGSKWVYSLEAMQMTVEGKSMLIKVTFVMPLPWTIVSQMEITLPMSVRSKVLYLN